MKLRSLILNFILAAALTPVAISLVNAKSVSETQPERTAVVSSHEQLEPAKDIEHVTCKKVRVVHGGYGEPTAGDCSAGRH